MTTVRPGGSRVKFEDGTGWTTGIVVGHCVVPALHLSGSPADAPPALLVLVKLDEPIVVDDPAIVDPVLGGPKLKHYITILPVHSEGLEDA